MIDKKIIKIMPEKYPQKLKIIKDLPKQLYVIGNVDLLYRPSFGIIGTRNLTEYGMKNCKFFAKEIALRNIPIVSGMAIGTDEIAHKTALECNSETIAVLGAGFNHVYPEKNKLLFENIIKKNGLVITEYNMDIPVCNRNFPKRNRIISALSDGILVIEAMFRSGTSITVKYAKNQNKKVFALPGRLDNCCGIGVNKMIKQGAILVTNINDILNEFPQFMNKKRKTLSKANFNCKNIKEEYKDIVKLLEKETLNYEEIHYKLNNSNITETIKLLITMELEGIISEDTGKGYKLILNSE